MSAFDDEIPRDVSVEWVAYRYRDIHRRVRALEDEADKYELPVMASELRRLSEDVRTLKRAFYTFAFSVVGSSVVFAFTVFALLGKH